MTELHLSSFGLVSVLLRKVPIVLPNSTVAICPTRFTKMHVFLVQCVIDFVIQWVIRSSKEGFFPHVDSWTIVIYLNCGFRNPDCFSERIYYDSSNADYKCWSRDCSAVSENFVNNWLPQNYMWRWRPKGNLKSDNLFKNQIGIGLCTMYIVLARISIFFVKPLSNCRTTSWK